MCQSSVRLICLHQGFTGKTARFAYRPIKKEERKKRHWTVLASFMFEHGSASSSQSSGLGESCHLEEVIGVGPQLFLQWCSMGPLLCSCLSEEGAEL